MRIGKSGITTNSPLVSIGVPVWNGERYVRQTLDALRAQDYPNLEIVVSDNGSTDGTEAICREYSALDQRFRYHRSPENHGGCWNFNRVAELAQGEYFMWAAADDVLLPHYVSACVERLEIRGQQTVLACPRVKLINSDGDLFGELGDSDLQADQQTPHERIYHILSREASHLVYGVMRAATLARTRGILPVVGDDVTLLTELACRGKIEVVPDQLFLQRRHDAQFSAQGRAQVNWFAPRGRARFAFPHTKLNIQLIKAVFVSGLPPAESLRSLLAVLRGWVLPKWRGMAGDCLAVLRR